MLTEDYRVRLDTFEGPMDLLLFLIRKSEVEVTDIPIANITDQYLAFLKGIDIVDIEAAGEFLLMAATLTEIKSRMLARKPAPSGQEGATPADEDPRAELVRQLLAYKQYRDAAAGLETRAGEWQSRFPAGRAAIDDERVRQAMDEMADVELDDLELVDLASAFARIIETVNFDRLGDHTVKYDETPIELHAEDILEHLRQTPAPEEGGASRLEFGRVFTGRTRAEMIGLFLAVLDLVRRQAVRVSQDAGDGQIYLSLREASAEAAAPAQEPASGA